MRAAPRLPPWPRLLLFFVAVVLVYRGVAPLVLSRWAAVWHAADLPVLAMFTLSTYPLMILVAWLFLRFVDRARLVDVGLAKGGWWRDAGRGVAIGVGFVGCLTGLYSIVGVGAFQRQVLAAPAWVLHMIAIYPLIGFAEELVFRGYLFKAAEEAAGQWWALLISSVLFWLPHLGTGEGDSLLELIAVPFYIATGTLLGLCRIASKGLWLPIGFHIAFNWASISLMGAPKPLGVPSFFLFAPTVPHWVVGPPGQGGVVDVALTLVLLGGVYLFLYRPSIEASKPRSP